MYGSNSCPGNIFAYDVIFVVDSVHWDCFQQDASTQDVQSMKLKNKLDNTKLNEDEPSEEQMDVDGEAVETGGEKVETMTVPRGLESSFHTAMEHLQFTVSFAQKPAQSTGVCSSMLCFFWCFQPGELDVEKLRSELEQHLTTLKEHPTEQVAVTEPHCERDFSIPHLFVWFPCVPSKKMLWRHGSSMKLLLPAFPKIFANSCV